MSTATCKHTYRQLSIMCTNIKANCVHKYNRICESLPLGEGCSGCHNAPIILSIIHNSYCVKIGQISGMIIHDSYYCSHWDQCKSLLRLVHERKSVEDFRAVFYGAEIPCVRCIDRCAMPSVQCRVCNMHHRLFHLVYIVECAACNALTGVHWQECINGCSTMCTLLSVRCKTCCALRGVPPCVQTGCVSGEDWCSLPPLFPGLPIQCNDGKYNAIQYQYNAALKIQCDANRTDCHNAQTDWTDAGGIE